jgi:hypothetical protein
VPKSSPRVKDADDLDIRSTSVETCRKSQASERAPAPQSRVGSTAPAVEWTIEYLRGFVGASLQDGVSTDTLRFSLYGLVSRLAPDRAPIRRWVK